MATIVLGIGCSHTPQLHTPAEQWEVRARRDRQDGVPLWYRGRQLKYADVEAMRAHLKLGEQTSMAIREERLKRSFEAMDRLAEAFSAARPDVTIVFGNDQGEMFLDDLKPAFTIMGAAEFRNMPRTADQNERLPPGIALADHGHLPESGSVRLPGQPALAAHLAEYVIGRGFDVAFSARQIHADPSRAQTGGMPHAYGFVYKQIFRDHFPPQVPIDTNTFYPPNQPRAERCYAFGQALGAAVRDWQEDARVCVIASGGLSHFVVDEAFDRDIMAAMKDSDFTRLLDYDEAYYQAGSSEIKSWIAAGGAMHGAGLHGHIVDYQALYRTPAGTGSSAAFMVWD
jgi:hypothetical protein